MDEKHQSGHMVEDEIDLRELFMVLWKKKVVIVCIILIAAILTGLASALFITPVYHSRLRIIINMPESYTTKYGNYALPITTNEQYIDLITSNDVIRKTIEDMGYDENIAIETIRERIQIEASDTKTNGSQNTFFVNVAADNPAEAKKLAKTLYNNFIDFLDALIIEGALNYYINKLSVALQAGEVSLASAKEILAKNEELLAATPQTISQKEAIQELNESDNISDYLIFDRIINPNYTKIENDIIENKQNINNIENSISLYNEQLAELNELKELLDSCRETGDLSPILAELVSPTDTNIYLPSEPIEPSRKTSPHNARNAVIGALLGGMMAVVVVLIKEYWFKPREAAENI
ncbi:MAG: hypothetical protein GX059_01330 [Clostridiales bacterium]|nr:hypothetical protein [Clostridiales bacterium]